MAEFNLWSKESLVKLAYEQEAHRKHQDEIIAELTAQVKAVHLAWRLALAQPVPSATLEPLTGEQSLRKQIEIFKGSNHV